MRIALDGACLTAPYGGVSRYLEGILAGLAELNDPDVDLHLLRPENRVRTVRWVLWTLQRLTADGYDLLHCPFYYPPLAPRCPVAVAIHDILVIERPDWFPAHWARVTGALIRRGARRAQAVITASTHVAQRLVDRCGVAPERISVIPYAVDPAVFHPPEAAEVEGVVTGIGLHRPYLVQLGAHEPRRGLDVVLASMTALRRNIPDLELVLIGEGRHRVAELVDPPAWVRRVGRLPDRFLPAVLAGALAVTAASRDEGFDLPLLEAMACGAAVVASDIPVHVEHFSPGVRLFASGEADDLARVIIEVAADQPCTGLRKAGLSHSKGFRWTEVARRHFQVWREVTS